MDDLQAIIGFTDFVYCDVCHLLCASCELEF
jgi:hypothetical protein